ncbi:Spy/CpxP family protein refolding chaperone [Winogradskyella pulchriflava]|uniref:Spy/CpxP family protein refolding chaperone n=1 Tax=Winogradskyella pulchriflava TaxID=1110688 RepID=A0ABV6QCN9_9FLAO
MKTVHTLIFLLFISASVFAQRPNREKIEALKIAHITEQLDLTKEEAQKFWPIYNANEEAENKLRARSNEARKNNKSDDLSESEAKALLLEMVSIEKERVALRSKMLNDLLEILPAKKIIALVQAERSFKQKIIQEFKERHTNRRNKK